MKKSIVTMISIALIGYFANNYTNGAFGEPQSWAIPICAIILGLIAIRKIIRKVIFFPIALLAKLVRGIL